MQTLDRNFLIRNWQPSDRTIVAKLIHNVLVEYSLPWQPETADRDVMEVETYYLETGGEFWVVEKQDAIVGTAAYYPINRGNQGVEIRKMYLIPEVRGQGLGTYLLAKLEKAIVSRGFQSIWIETATVLSQAVHLYEHNGYEIASGVETPRCDRIYFKSLTN